MSDLLTETKAPPSPVPLTAGAVPGETDTWRWLQRLIEEAERGRRDEGNDKDWTGSHRIYWGEQWGGITLPSWKPPIVVNELKTLILTELSELMDTEIKVYVHKDRTHGERDKVVEQAIQAEWERQSVNLVLAQAMLYAMIYPAAFLGCFIKQTADGQKELDIRALHPSLVYPDPDATSDEDWTYVLIKEVQDLRKIRQDFPERGPRVKPESAHSVRLGSEDRTPWWSFWRKGGTGYLGPLTTPTGASLSGYIKARVSKYTLFIYDDDTEEEPQELLDDAGHPVLDENGRPMLRIVKTQRYPRGRQIVASNGVVLYDDPYEYVGPFPVIRLLAEPTTGEFWLPTSPVQGVQELFMAGNKMDSQVVENAIRLNNGMVVADTSTGIRMGDLAAIPGQKILKGPGKFEVIMPPPFPESMTKMGSFFRELGAKVLGFPPGRLSQGQRGNVSAALTDTEISQAMGVSRLRARMLHQAVTKLVQQMFYRMAQYQTVKRVIITPTGEAVPWEPIDPGNISEYLVHVDPASFSLRSKASLQRLILLLARMGKVSTEYALKKLELPDAEEEAKKLQMELMLVSQAKAASRGKKK